MLERLNFFLGGCGGKGAQDGDCIEALNQDIDALEKEGALAVIIVVFSDAPSLIIIIIIIIIIKLTLCSPTLTVKTVTSVLMRIICSNV